jgi:predicted lipase
VTNQYSEVHGYVARDDSPGAGRIIIAIRGTNNDENIEIDLDVLFTDGGLIAGCDNCRVHSGFYDAYTAVSNIIEGTVLNETAAHPSYQLVISGHSLGGAIAAMLVILMLDRSYPRGYLTRPAGATHSL